MFVHNGRISSDEEHAIRRNVPRKNNVLLKDRNYANCRRLTKITNVTRRVQRGFICHLWTFLTQQKIVYSMRKLGRRFSLKTSTTVNETISLVISFTRSSLSAGEYKRMSSFLALLKITCFACGSHYNKSLFSY